MKDEAIARSLQQKDPEVIAFLIQKYSRLLWPIAEGILKDIGCTQDVEECVADIFIQLWEHPEKFDPGRGTLKSYMCLLTRSRALDRFRQLTRNNTVPLEETVLLSDLDLDKGLSLALLRSRLGMLLRDLPDTPRDILLRRYYYDQKPRQIARALDLTPKQVNDILYRTKRQLRQRLSQEGGTPWDL